MGYSTSPKLIASNVELLLSIKESIDRGDSIHLSVPLEVNPSTETYNLRRILASTDHFPEFLDGAFAFLGQEVSLRFDPKKREIICSPRNRLKVVESEFRASESDALDQLAETSVSLTMLEFFPSSSFSESEFVSRCADIGWELLTETKELQPDGAVLYAASRLPKEA